MYVEIEPTKIEGMVSLREIRSDFFEFDEKKSRLVGRRTRKVYNLGDPVRIRVKATNLEQKLLDYELIEDVAQQLSEELTEAVEPAPVHKPSRVRRPSRPRTSGKASGKTVGAKRNSGRKNKQ